MKNIKTTHRPNTSVLSDVWTSNFGQIVNDILQEPIATNQYVPRINLLEKENGYELKAALPGISKEDISISIEDGVLKLSTKKEEAIRNETDKILINEMIAGTYSRAIRLPKSADTEHSDATLENGILKIYLAKRKESLPKQIEIK